MGLLDKLKNVFFEEEYVEVEEKPVVKTVQKELPKEKVQERNMVAKKIEPPKRETVEVTQAESVEVLEEKEELSDRELLKPETSFRLYEDDDFACETKEEENKIKAVPPIDRKEERHIPYGGAVSEANYQNLYKGEKKEKEFHPTPIISPIYGILDKNYSKEDIVDKKERRTASSYARKIDLDSVRKKAYGELSHDLGMGGTDPIKENEEEVELEDNLLYDMDEHDSTPAVEKVTLADAEEYFEDLGLEYNIDYKDKAQEKASGRRVRHTRDYDVEENNEEVLVPDSKEKIEEAPNSLEDNLFDLIDSMYEDKE